MADTLILIAAGGAGRRLGGGKPAVRLAGRRLIDHAMAFAAAQGGAIRIAAPVPLADASAPWLADPGIGPIGALAAGMAEAQRLGLAQLLMIGCDMPFLPADLLPRLAAALPGYAAALPECGGQLQPLAGLWRVDVPALAGFIAGGGRSPRDFARAQGMAPVPFPAGDAERFFNINTPADLAAAARRLKPAR